MANKIILINELERALLELNQDLVESIILRSQKSSSPIETASGLITDTLTRIGESWERGELALSQVYMSSLICERIIDKILPPKSPIRNDAPVTAIGVFEDYHLLGKRIISSTLRASGIELIDLGGGLTCEDVIKHAEEKHIKILLLSVLMLPSALRMKDLIKKLMEQDVKVIVGGAPFRFDEKLAAEIGAPYYGKDSAEALIIVRKLMNENA